MIALYSNKEQAADPPKNLGILISLKNSRIGQESTIESGWAEITARFVAVPTGGGGHSLVLTEIQRLDRLWKDPENQ
jgi:hypothetical protein